MLNIWKRASIIGRLRFLLLDRYYSRFVKVGLVTLCITATLASTLIWRELTPQTLIIGLAPIILVAGLAFSTMLYLNLEWATFIPIIVSTVLSDGVSTGTETKLSFTFLLLLVWAVLWGFKMVIVERQINLRPSPANVPALIMMVIVVLSLIWSSTYAERGVNVLLESKIPVRVMTALVIIISITTYLMYSNLVRSMRTIRFFAWWFIILGGIFVVMRLGLGQVPTPLNAKGQFPTWVGILCLGQVLFNPNLKRWLRLALLGILGGWVYVTYSLGVGWLSGWLPLAVGCLILLFLYSRPAFFTVLLIGIVALLINFASVESALSNESSESGGTRVDAWNNALAVVEKHPLLGTGPAGYFFYFSATLTGFFQLSHNNYIDIIAQTGLAGITVWIILWIGIGVMTWRMYRIVPPEAGFERALANTLFASYFCTVVAMMLGDWVTPFPYTQTLAGIDYTIWAWMLPGLTVALYYIYRDKAVSEKSDITKIGDPVIGENSVPALTIPKREYYP